MANENIYQSDFTGQQMDERFRAVATLAEALTVLEQAIAAKYTKPAGGIPATDLDADVNAALAKANSAIQSLADYYTKSEIDAMMSAVNSQEYETAATLPTASASTMGKIYLIGPDGSGYYSYYFTSYDGSAYSWVGPLGTTEISLAGYAPKDELDQLEQIVDDLADAVNYVPASPNLMVGAELVRLVANTTTQKYVTVANAQSYVIPVTGGKKYTVYLGATANRFYLGLSVDAPANGVSYTYYSSSFPNGSTQEITAGANDRYLLVYVNSGTDISTAGMFVYEGAYHTKALTDIDGLGSRLLQQTGTPPDLNTNFVWPRFSAYSGGSIDYDAFVTLISATAVRVKNTSFPTWYGNQVNVTFGSDGQCMIRQRIETGSVKTGKKYKFVVELSVSGTITLAQVYVGVDANVTRYQKFEGNNPAGVLIHSFTNSDITAGTSDNVFDVWLRLWGNNGTVASIGRVSLIEQDSADADYAVPYFPLVPTTDRSTTEAIHALSPYFGKKFYSFGDSITSQQRWQPILARLFQMAFNSASVTDEDHPLGIGGASICPYVRIVTTDEGEANKVIGAGGVQMTDGDNNPLWFRTGGAPDMSLYYRASFFSTYDDAQVIVIGGGQNDEITVTYDSVGQPGDAPYQGKPYVLTEYAEVADYYDVAIYDDGTLDRTQYPPEDYTIITSKPTLSACVAGMVKKICTACPAARVIAFSMMRLNKDVSEERSVRVAQKDAIIAAFEHYGIPVANLWDEMNTNVYNYTTYYADDVHPNAAGGQRMAEVISKVL